MAKGLRADLVICVGFEIGTVVSIQLCRCSFGTMSTEKRHGQGVAQKHDVLSILEIPVKKDQVDTRYSCIVHLKLCI